MIKSAHNDKKRKFPRKNILFAIIILILSIIFSVGVYFINIWINIWSINSKNELQFKKEKQARKEKCIGDERETYDSIVQEWLDIGKETKEAITLEYYELLKTQYQNAVNNCLETYK